MIRAELGDCREVAPTLGVTVDSIVCDPPYNLVAMTKRFGNGQAAAKSPDHQRFAKGFMGQQWDGTGIAFDPETWRLLGSVLRPGGFVLAFGGTRTYHRMASAIEDAGFVIQDCINWLYGSGFPKRRDMLKPGVELIAMAYKPGGKRTLQIDECRVATHGETFGDPADYASRSRQKSDGWLRPHHGEPADLSRAADAITKAEALGRWPANVCHDGSDEVIAAFAEFGDTASGHYPKARGAGGGSADRFFYSSKADSEDRWGSRHPTVKPVELLKWLVALVTPPGGVVLDPFAGSGTTGIAALATGRDAILIERGPQYFADIQARLAYYRGEGAHALVAKSRARPQTPLGGLFAGKDSE